MSRLLIYVQYLKGIGHLQRMRLVAEAGARRGLEVHLATGGLPLPDFHAEGATLHQLAPLQAGPGGFADLVDARGHAIDEAWRSARRDRLLALFAEIEPDVLLIESFPFGRRRLSFELIPLLEAAHERARRPLIACSVRDILQESSKPARTAETLDRLNAYFDAVLVHGDPAFARLDETFPAAADIAAKLHYTGFVTAPAQAFAPHDGTPGGEIVVSIGGGAVGPALLEAALAARPLAGLQETPWRLITGPNLPEGDAARLREAASEGVTVDRFRADFRRLLAAAKLSISYAGYNTVMDLMRARVPAVLVTYGGDKGGETEQRHRAARLEALGRACVLSDADLSTERLAAAIGAALALNPTAEPAFDMDGAATTAETLIGLSAARALQP